MLWATLNSRLGYARILVVWFVVFGGVLLRISGVFAGNLGICCVDLSLLVGFRNFEIFNQAMLAKQFWRLHSRKDSWLLGFSKPVTTLTTRFRKLRSVIILALDGVAFRVIERFWDMVFDGRWAMGRVSVCGLTRGLMGLGRGVLFPLGVIYRLMLHLTSSLIRIRRSGGLTWCERFFSSFWGWQNS